MKTKLTYLLLVATLCGCGGVKIEQEISDASLIRGTKYINTRVWVRHWSGLPITLEYSEQKCVPYSKVDSTKEAEYLKAVPIWQAAKNYQ